MKTYYQRTRTILILFKFFKLFLYEICTIAKIFSKTGIYLLNARYINVFFRKDKYNT